ncbi:hypothetical protein VTL71DRAFT_9402 [Oculimacula yallundae]|uniref:Uncharacterized protein n=1 Tax=Oculimacula yallundae TaxID=86028 RepID=A0ABR4BSZ3_9HELO
MNHKRPSNDADEGRVKRSKGQGKGKEREIQNASESEGGHTSKSVPEQGLKQSSRGPGQTQSSSLPPARTEQRAQSKKVLDKRYRASRGSNVARPAPLWTTRDQQQLSKTSEEEMTMFRRFMHYHRDTPYNALDRVIVHIATESANDFEVPNTMMSQRYCRSLSELICIPYLWQQKPLLTLALECARKYRLGEDYNTDKRDNRRFDRLYNILRVRFDIDDDEGRGVVFDAFDSVFGNDMPLHWQFVLKIPEAFKAANREGSVGPNGHISETGVTLLDLKVLQISWDIYARATQENSITLKLYKEYLAVARDVYLRLPKQEILDAKKDYIIAWRRARQVNEDGEVGSSQDHEPDSSAEHRFDTPNLSRGPSPEDSAEEEEEFYGIADKSKLPLPGAERSNSGSTQKTQVATAAASSAGSPKKATIPRESLSARSQQRSPVQIIYLSSDSSEPAVEHRNTPTSRPQRSKKTQENIRTTSVDQTLPTDSVLSGRNNITLPAPDRWPSVVISLNTPPSLKRTPFYFNNRSFATPDEASLYLSKDKKADMGNTPFDQNWHVKEYFHLHDANDRWLEGMPIEGFSHSAAYKLETSTYARAEVNEAAGVEVETQIWSADDNI